MIGDFSWSRRWTISASRSVALVDLFGGTTDADAQPEFSNDGLHFSTAGYRRFADLVAAMLVATLPS